jgi:putative transposase
MPFKTEAVCLLPDHLHCIWALPEDESDYSIRWSEIKRLFTRAYVREIGPGGERGESRRKRREAAVWQRRFWEHMIRNEEDLNRHIDDIHYNPVKHGLVKRVCDWPWSSFHRYVRMGFYEREWGEADEEWFDLRCGE